MGIGKVEPNEQHEQGRTKLARAGLTRGRPAVLSRDAIVEVALTLLDTNPREELSMARIARELGVSPPALNRYFTNRAALLNAMSASVFAHFPEMTDNVPWRDQLLSWQRDVAQLFARHRGLMKLMVWDDQLSGPWLRVQAPVFEVLHSLGLTGTALVETSTWFLASTIGLFRTFLPDEAVHNRQAYLLEVDEGLEYLTPSQRAIFEESRLAFPDVKPDRILTTGLTVLIEGVARALDLSREDRPAALKVKAGSSAPSSRDQLTFEIEIDKQIIGTLAAVLQTLK